MGGLRPLNAAIVIVLAALALWGGARADEPAPLRNALGGHPSPYLALHAEDPVHWQVWGPAVLERARRTGRPIFVSSGYFACHWCHVMQRESFSDPDVARLLNAHFVPVKVDRELEPELDARLLAFVRRTRGAAGWPLNVVLTPAGHPLLGMVYLPPVELRAVLADLARRWAEDAPTLRAMARGAAEPEAPSPAAQDAPAPAVFRRALVDAALAAGDELVGGFGEQAKFPHAPRLRALVAAQARAGEPPLAAFLALTLEHMAGGGLRDHLGGGFFRYTEDPAWRHPHFEKMLHTNAQLATLYLEAGRVLGRDDFRAVGLETVDFLLRDMATARGAYIAGFSAVDDAGREGGYYLWRAETVRGLVPARDWPLVRDYWGFAGAPDFAHGHLPVPQADVEALAAALRVPALGAAARLQTARNRLLAARSRRGLPSDDTIIAAWNGLALEALVQAARAPGHELYRIEASCLRDNLARNFWDGQALVRARGPTGPLGRAALEDYAYIARGLWAWTRHFGDADDLWLTRAVVDAAWTRFHGEGGWRTDPGSLLPDAAPRAALPDGTLPSPAAVLIDVSLALATRMDDAGLARRARAALAAAGPALAARPLEHAGYGEALAAAGVSDNGSSSATE